jgi:hypothetical protein
MGTPRQPGQVQFFASLIFRDEGLLSLAGDALCKVMGSLCDRTPIVPFDQTEYYEKEMGRDLLRTFYFFEPLRERELLAAVKIITNRIEMEFAEAGCRRINIDAGYVSLEQVILATTKGFSHRIYLGSGIYGDLTLFYQDGSFRPLPWTYPDYGSAPCISMFNMWREKYKMALKENIRGEAGR